MEREFSNFFSCPFCRGRLSIKATETGTDGKIKKAVAKCGCNIYCIWNGILVLMQNTKAALDEIKNIEIKISETESRIKEKNIDQSLLNFLTEYAKNETTLYMKYRFSFPSFHTNFSIFPLVKNSSFVLDLGCGIGALSWLFKAFFPHSKIFSVDFKFLYLLLAQKYFLQDATYIQLDLNFPLPFESGLFDVVFCQDTLHYIFSKYNLINEIKRVANKKAQIFLYHLHNKKYFNTNQYWPLLPEGYLRLTEELNPKIYPEEYLLEWVLGRRDCGFLKETLHEQELMDSENLAIISSKGSPPSPTERPSSFLLKKGGRFILNPLYSLKEKKEEKSLYTYSFPTKRFEEEAYRLKEYMPHELFLPNNLSALLNHKDNFHLLDQHLLDFSILRVPEKYGKSL